MIWSLPCCASKYVWQPFTVGKHVLWLSEKSFVGAGWILWVSSVVRLCHSASMGELCVVSCAIVGELHVVVSSMCWWGNGGGSQESSTTNREQLLMYGFDLQREWKFAFPSWYQWGGESFGSLHLYITPCHPLRKKNYAISQKHPLGAIIWHCHIENILSVP